MKLILIRHGEPTYEEITGHGYIGFGFDLAKLTPLGQSQAENVSHDERLLGAQLILSSPYTRALQTASVISRNTGLSIEVETDLHEWLPDTTCRYPDMAFAAQASAERIRFRGKHTDECKYPWEELEHVADRVFRCLRKYLHYDKVIVVTHYVVMSQFRFEFGLDFCGIQEVDFDEDFQWPRFCAG
jgi:broad specificity phosphatase PhoE